MAPRPNWKGFLKLSLVSCSISLYPATSASERVSFNQINKTTGNRIRYKKVDGDTGEEVSQADIVKGYQVEKNVYVTVEDEELEALQVDSSHTIEIDKFVPLTDIDERYFDAPYYIVPNDEVGQDAFAVIRDAMREQEDGRPRPRGHREARTTDHLAPLDKGLEGFTLRYPYEVRKEERVLRGHSRREGLGRHAQARRAHRREQGRRVSILPNWLTTMKVAVVEMLKQKQAGKPIRKEAARTRPREAGTSSTC